jgi:tetratricopeptide (TPR) repeat protein
MENTTSAPLPQLPRSPARRRRRAAGIVVVCLLLVAFVVSALFATRVETVDLPVLLKKMKDEYTAGVRAANEKNRDKALEHYTESLELAKRVLKVQPNQPAASLVAGQILIGLERPNEALSYFKDVNDNTTEAALCYVSAAQLLIDQGSKYQEAETYLRRAIRVQPSLAEPYQVLAFVLSLGTRTWERIPVALQLISKEHINIIDLETLANNDRMPPDINLVMKGLKENPDDPNVLLGYANLKRAEQKYTECEELLRKVIKIAPEITEAQVRLGRTLFESGQDAKYVEWQAAAKDAFNSHPMFWLIRGERAEHVGEKQVAARCYWEAVKLDPNEQDAVYRLGQVLLELGRKSDAAPFLDRSRHLVTYRDLVRKNYVRAQELGGKGDIELSQQALKTADVLGDIWDTFAWLHMTLELDPSNKALQQPLEDMKNGADKISKTDRTAGKYNPANNVDLSNLPLPNWQPSSHPVAEASAAPPVRPVSFADQAESAGIHFQFIDGSDPEIHALNKMYQMNGGGVGVLDFDRDGWPDIYFTQGSPDPQDREQKQHVDRLFRNLGDGHFADVTASAGLVENAFSQGIAVGDMNNDGFPDVYVGNIGPNRLFVNNGDGTFSDASEESGAVESQWTTSCVIADLNGDSLPDVYAVGFLEGDAMTRVCNSRDRRLDPCIPLQFPTSRHRIWQNLGDGHFKDVSSSAGLEQASGAGMSIVAADVDRTRKLNVLVGNHGAPNFYLRNHTTGPAEPPGLTDEALYAGLALGYDGSPHACQGIAAGDFNGDGLLDFHGSSILEQADTLFLQQPGGLFVDASRPSGLYRSTFMFVGFGTQAIDGALDGKLDLFTAQGNSDNPQNEYVMYEMPPRYFQNDGHARFTEVPSEQLGPFFQRKYLGRSVARLDWNRDGREDLVISNLRAPAALLTNTTSHPGHHLSLRLVATGSARDAIGTTVEVSVHGTTLMRQLTAGDGFQASNERLLVFGLGPNTTVDSVTIHWMSGRVQKLAATPGDRELLLVEGRSEPVVMPRP